MTNPTSNFGWQMPTSTDLVTDLPADFAVFGQAVDTTMADLKGGTTGQVLAKASNTDMDFVWSADAAGMTNPMTTTGDMIYSSSGSTPARRGIGTTGQVLTVSGGIPTWATPAGGGGKVLQVVTATYAVETATSSTSYGDTGLTVTITPTLATSKVYAIAVIGGLYKSAGSVNNAVNLKLLRAATSLITKTGYLASGSTAASQVDGTLSYLDSPATTSATIYKVQFANAVASAEVYVQNASNTSTIVLMEIGV